MRSKPYLLLSPDGKIYKISAIRVSSGCPVSFYAIDAQNNVISFGSGISGDIVIAPPLPVVMIWYDVVSLPNNSLDVDVVFESEMSL